MPAIIDSHVHVVLSVIFEYADLGPRIECTHKKRMSGIYRGARYNITNETQDIVPEICESLIKKGACPFILTVAMR